jgi:hypothetical protein
MSPAGLAVGTNRSSDVEGPSLVAEGRAVHDYFSVTTTTTEVIN